MLTGRLPRLREETQSYAKPHASAHSKVREYNRVAHIHTTLLKIINAFT
jgi:hypothetical protein